MDNITKLSTGYKYPSLADTKFCVSISTNKRHCNHIGGACFWYINHFTMYMRCEILNIIFNIYIYIYVCVFVCMAKTMQLRWISSQYMNDLQMCIEDTSYHCFQQGIKPGLVAAHCTFVKHCFSWTSCKIGNNHYHHNHFNCWNVVYLLIDTKKVSWCKVQFCFHYIMPIFYVYQSKWPMHNGNLCLCDSFIWLIKENHCVYAMTGSGFYYSCYVKWRR